MTDNRRDFDKEAAQWDENPIWVKLAKDLLEAIVKQVPLNSAMHVLDFGCGTGILTVGMASLAGMVTGVDSSKGMIDVLHAKIEKHKIDNIRVSCLDLERGGHLKGRYDLILTCMTLHHIKKIGTVLRQFHNSLAPGGYVCIADLDPDEGLFHDNNKGVFHFGFERAGLYSAMMTAGFGRILNKTAAEVIKPVPNGEVNRFTAFVMTGRKI